MKSYAYTPNLELQADGQRKTIYVKMVPNRDITNTSSNAKIARIHSFNQTKQTNLSAIASQHDYETEKRTWGKLSEANDTITFTGTVRGLNAN